MSGGCLDEWTSCPCNCHAPARSPWAGWCVECEDIHQANLVDVARQEVVSLWNDMERQSRESIAAPGAMSVGMEGKADRIVRLSRLVGAAPWEAVATSVLLSGVYERVYDRAGIGYPMIDWDRVQAVHAKHLS